MGDWCEIRRFLVLSIGIETPRFRSLVREFPGIGMAVVDVRHDVPAPPRSSRVGDWIWPSGVCLPAAILSVAVSWPEKLFELTPGGLPASLDISGGETKEFGLALFLMLYLISLHLALRTEEARSPQG